MIVAPNDTVKDAKVIKKVKKEKSKIFSFAPGSWQLLGPLPIQADRSIGTYATDGQKILVNPDYSKSLNHLEIKGTLLHEEMHVSKCHHLRRGDRLPVAWNYACDYQINGELVRGSGYGRLYTLPHGFLYDDLYSTCNWSVEKIYNDMMRNGWTEPPPPPPGGSPGGSETTGGGVGEILDSPNADDPVANEQEQQEIMERVRDAQLLEKAMSKEGEGNITNNVNGESDRGTASSDLIRKFLRKTFSQKRSFRRPNKRFLSQNILMPARTKVVQDLYIAIDSSASVGLTEFEQYRKNIVRWIREIKLQRIHVSYIDTRIHKNPDTNKAWWTIDLTSNANPDALAMDFYGGGGTNFDPIFKYIRDENEESQVGALVYFTDGFGDVDDITHVPYPVLWVTSGRAPSFYNEEGDSWEGCGSVVEI